MVYPMPSFIESSMKTQNIIMILMEICLILELIVLFSRMIRSVGKRKIMITAVEFFLSFLFMSGLLNEHRLHVDHDHYKPLFHSFPAYLMLLLVILLTVYLVFAIRKEIKEYHHSLSPWSVHEAVNHVPCGVCFSVSLY